MTRRKPSQVREAEAAPESAPEPTAAPAPAPAPVLLSEDLGDGLPAFEFVGSARSPLPLGFVASNRGKCGQVVSYGDAQELADAFSKLEPPTESIVKGIIHQIEHSPGVREAIARLMATNAEITESNGGQPPVAFVLEPLWVERLGKMAGAVGQAPGQYLETLLKRAWCSMDPRLRS